ncbi:GPN-loop GTPase 2-like [Argonauta hians]
MFAQLVIGPPGSGKTTYCRGMSEFMQKLGRKVSIVNLDPANDFIPYKPDINISELITLEEVMESLKLGPNGGLIYCMEYLDKNIEWLINRLKDIPKDHYIMFDCPGQVELYSHNSAVHNIVEALQKLDYRLVAVHLVDAHYCGDAGKFISVLLTSLITMLQVSLPHVNVLSKADLIQKYGKLAFNLDFYTDVLDLNYLLEHLQDDEIFRKYKKLNTAMVGIIEDYSLVSFVALNVTQNSSMLRVLQAVDKAVGYMFGDTEERNIQSLLSCAIGAEFEYEKIKDIQERYVSACDNDDDIDDETDTKMEL